MLSKKYASQGTAVATFDYTDIASGTGYSIFYGANAADGTISGSYILSDNVFYSNKITTFAEITGGVKVKAIGMDFDVSFNMPRIIKGDMIISVPVGVGRKGEETGGTLTCNISGSVILYDGTNETTLASFRSTDFAADDTVGANNYKVLSTKVPITQQHFKGGEILRVSIEGWGSISTGVTRYVAIGHDPKNVNDPELNLAGRCIYNSITSAFGPTTMEVHVPFKIDL